MKTRIFGSLFLINQYVIATPKQLTGKLRGRHSSLKAMDAMQIAVSLKVEADVFITNDAKLKQIEELKVIVLRDYL